ncbi:MAG: single-stranded-DNA-specific exonuclease RecJ [Solitalea-like symbiont of Acarus siro]
MAKKEWIYEQVDNQKFAELKNRLKLTDPLIISLIKRDIYTFDEAKGFFRPDFSQIKDPFLLKDIEKAINRIEDAINNKEKILIYGDYDADGVTSVSIIYNFFSKIYTNIYYYIPDRHKEGYGMSANSIQLAKQNNYSLIIAIDCGTTNVYEIELAKQLSIDVIVIDHHIPTDTLPKAIALINPKQAECTYPFKEFAACGLCFKFIHAFAIKHKIPIEDYYNLIELAAIGTSSDLVPLTGENRTITFLGLEILNNRPSIGIRSILNIYQIIKKCDTQDIAFKIAPLLNAAGRMAHAHLAVELLTTTSESIAYKTSLLIFEQNKLRKEIEQQATQEAVKTIKGKEIETFSTVIYNENWHKGVIGIVASKLQEFSYKPTIILTQSNNLIVGSARSVEGFDIYNSIHQCNHLLEQYGGHKYAAGLSLKPENLYKFKILFEESVKNNIQPDSLTEKIKIDAPIKLEHITENFIKVISQFEPVGQLNKPLVFASKNVEIYGKINNLNNKHLKFYVKQDNTIFECIAFNLGHIYDTLLKAKFITICYVITKNIWKGNTTIQLMIKDVKIHSIQQKTNNTLNVYHKSC